MAFCPGLDRSVILAVRYRCLVLGIIRLGGSWAGRVVVCILNVDCPACSVSGFLTVYS